MQKTINVQGMSCDHCKMTVENAVRALSGVSQADVDLKAGNVSVSFDIDQVSEDKIKQTIRESGYQPA